MYYIKNNEFFCEGIRLVDLVKKYQTPLYIYSLKQLQTNIDIIQKPFSHYFPKGLICYAVKANSNLSFLKYIAQQGLGFDIVSGGELERVLQIQSHLNNVVYSGTTKTPQELEKAILHNIFMINCESLSEIHLIGKLAQKYQKKVSLAIRVNPDVDPHTHPNIDTGHGGAKFGIARANVLEACQFVHNYEFLHLQGLSCHIGSMVQKEEYYFEMLDKLIVIIDILQQHHITIEYLDLGGGYAVQYTQESTIDFEKLFKHFYKILTSYNLIPIIEPGRSIICNAGALLTKAIYTKQQNQHHFMFLDAGMTELIRPALYQAIHKIIAITSSSSVPISYTLGGPICESSDVFRDNIELFAEEGDILLIENAGAYGYSMASNYNTRAKSPEVLIDKDKDILINKREVISDLWRTEILTDLS